MTSKLTGRQDNPSDNGKASHITTQQDVQPAKRCLASFAEINEGPLVYLWRDRIALRAVTLLAGESEAGKSTLATEIAAAVTQGMALPGGPDLAPGNVLWYGKEELQGATIKARLQAASADLSRVFSGEYGPGGEYLGALTLPNKAAILEQQIRDLHIVLVIFDPISAYAEHPEAADSPAMARSICHTLTDICKRTNCGALLIKHPRKFTGLGGAKDQVAGSKEWVNVPRFAFVAMPHPHIEGLKCLAPLKGSLTKQRTTLTYRIVDRGGPAGILLGDECPLTADELFQSGGSSDERDVFEDAKELCMAKVRPGQEVKAQDMYEAGRQLEISPKKMRAARKHLGITVHTVGPNHERHRVWRAPAGGYPGERVPDQPSSLNPPQTGTEARKKRRK